MCLYMLLQILRPLEGLPTEIALMRFQRDMHANVRSDVVAFDCCGATVAPMTYQVEVVRALPTNVPLANVFLNIILTCQHTVIECITY